jgi:hypothetical protein
VIIETNKSTERLFPAVPDVESPEFFMRMDRLVEYNSKVRSHQRACAGNGWRFRAAATPRLVSCLLW